MQQRDNNGVLFKNDRKHKDTHPDYQGLVTVGNKPYEIAAWIKQGQKGKFMSLSFKPKTQAERQVEDEFDSEIPF